MAYGDGGFFFTQPVGNGYGGLDALAYGDPRYAQGYQTSYPPTNSCLRRPDDCSAQEVRQEIKQVEASLESLYTKKSLAMARGQGRLSASYADAIQDRRRGLAFLRELLALRMAYARGARQGRRASESRSTPLRFRGQAGMVYASGASGASGAAGAAASNDLFGQGAEGLYPDDIRYGPYVAPAPTETQEYTTADMADLEESVSLLDDPVGWVRANPLLTAGIGAAAFFGFRVWKRRRTF
jgi:hypothetical protein